MADVNRDGKTLNVESSDRSETLLLDGTFSATRYTVYTKRNTICTQCTITRAFSEVSI